MEKKEFREKLNELDQRLKKMVEYQQYFCRETNSVRREIDILKAATQRFEAEQKTAEKTLIVETATQPQYSPPVFEQVNPQIPEKREANQRQEPPQQRQHQATYSAPESSFKSAKKTNLEKFIGENLISLIGIIITVLGVGIGAKYAIDHNLISPLTRIILGYLFGFGLLGFARRLKTDYHDFSAVLLSGAMAIMYFITFAAHSYYNLIGQFSAFVLMFFLTDLTVLAALRYNRQIVAQIGLVGAYAIPFLLGGDASNIVMLLAYTAIINIGILAVSIKKYWKSIFYSSFIFTWASFGLWFSESYKGGENFSLALGFATLFFAIFYVTFLVYKLINKETFGRGNVLLLLLNSFVFYGFGHAILQTRAGGEQILGLFTIANAALHFVAAYGLKKLGIVDRAVFQMLAGMGLAFVTIAIPVQLDGNWVTLLWTMLAALLFWISRTRSASLYEVFSYPLMLLASLSLLSDWMILADQQSSFNPNAALTPIFNVYFLTAMLFVAAFAFICRVNKNEDYLRAVDDSLYQTTRFVFPMIFLFVLYNAFRLEINNYWHLLSSESKISFSPDAAVISMPLTFNQNLSSFNFLAQLNYTMLFLTVLGFVNLKKVQDFQFGLINLALNAIALLTFLTGGLLVLSELRANYLQHASADSYAGGAFHIVVRYISYFFVAGLFVSCYQYIKQNFVCERIANNKLSLAFDFAFFVSLWWLASSEIVNLFDITGYNQSDKLGLSVLWSVFALVLIVLGIAQNKKHLRIGAIVLSGLTIAKIFFYDIVRLDTISKTIVFVSLGVSLLAISFLYNKYKSLIFESNET